ncbi:ABC transporter ATP-binding protein [Halopseudomonas pelagia]|uniref:ABC transporter ATP-binding protein n=1 Tax=Halopseudomonas pelagia TaxID=553151 RepID=UPI00039E9EC7|nr:ABC transporter ATP-binding protein [Halopseudomonas pelagia]|tara:strand:+ start:23645 stop:24847 length:1203 start_codon:yes stop_codon:yes gene_type:complete
MKANSLSMVSGQRGEPLRLKAVSKRFGEVQALSEVSFSAEPGEVIALCGPSGAGKSTLGRLISGLDVPDSGSIHLGDRVFSELAAQQRRVAHMFESLALYPTLDVFSNVASPLRAPSHRGLFSSAEINSQVQAILAMMDIAHLSKRRPSELSGGQRQRVALCRTLVQSPSLFILDEPIGHLDAKLRHRLRGEINRRQRALDQVTLWLTPDTLEGMAVADRVIMLIGGKVQQIGTPRDVYAAPASTSIARLLGDPAMNLIDIWLKQEADGLKVLCNGERLQVSESFLARLKATGQLRLTLGFPPLHTRLDEPAAAAGLRGDIYTVEPFGKYTLVTVEVNGAQVKAKLPAGFQINVGSGVQIGIPVEHVLLFDHQSGLLIDEAAVPLHNKKVSEPNTLHSEA